MTQHQNERAFVMDWPEPDPRFLRSECMPAPEIASATIFGKKWANWISTAAEAKSAPSDYAIAALLTVAGALIGNTRWVSPWAGWSEPPIIWMMAIGLPSSGKSPALDAVISPLKVLETALRKVTEGERAEWHEHSEVAKLAESTWKEAAKAALKEGEAPPKRPDTANTRTEPFAPRLCIADGTIERLAVVLEKQARGTLVARDELSGWLHGMTRYAGGGSDRPFWLEAYGGRGYTVERMGRDPVNIDRLSIGVVGGIQPDKLKSLLMKTDDDGLLARFTPIWPEPVPVKRPQSVPDDVFIRNALDRLWSLRMVTDEHDVTRPWHIPFTEQARDRLDTLRIHLRSIETEADGLILSYIGKLSGLTIRLALVIAYLDWAVDGGDEPFEITEGIFDRAALFVTDYALPMARRSYGSVSLTKPERAAHRLVALIKAKAWTQFSSREVLRLERSGLSRATEVNVAVVVLLESNIIIELECEVNPKGGRPKRMFLVNPAIYEAT